jgi:hypothetical protein
MSDLRRFLRAASALALVLCAALPASAQSAAELQLRRDSLQLRFKAARARLDTAQNTARAVPDDSLLLHGAVLYFNSANLDERERRSLTRAFDVAAAELQELFGPEGTSLLEGQLWFVTVTGPFWIRGEPRLGLETLENGRRTTESLNLPIRTEAVVNMVRRRSGRQLVSTQPRIRDWTAGFRLDDPTTTHYFAHRHLALHQSSPARRCARGNVDACADIFSPAARDRWFDPTDIVNVDRDPTSGAVRESVLRYAVEVDGPGVLRAFQVPADSTIDRIGFIAAAVNQTPDEFLRGWQARLADSGAVRVRATRGGIAAALGWFALFGIVATRRRPA